MAAYNKFNDANNQLMRGTHQLHAAGHTVKVYLSNSAPVATNTGKSDIAEISAGNGYTAGGYDIQNDVTTSVGAASLTGVDVTITASGGSVGPFQYAVLYNDTATGDPLLGWYDYGSPVTLSDGEPFTIDFAATILDLT